MKLYSFICVLLLCSSIMLNAMDRQFILAWIALIEMQEKQQFEHKKQQQNRAVPKFTPIKSKHTKKRPKPNITLPRNKE